MGQPTSDAAFELLGACAHSLRFALGAPLDYPYAPARLADDPPPAMFRRLQAVSPPPGRDGGDWHTGMTLDGKPFQPGAWTDRLAEVRHEEGVASLDVAEPEAVLVDRWITVPRQRRTMAFPGADRGRYLVSIGYWSPVPASGEQVEKEVQYYGEYRVDWTRPPADDWVAVSFDAFWPPERDSADLIIPLGDCDERCPGTRESSGLPV